MSLSREERWHAQYSEVKLFLDANGRAPRIFCPEEKAEEALGRWMSVQRRRGAAGQLTVGRIALLKALPVPDVVLANRPEPDRLRLLAEFVRVHDRLPKSTSPKDSEEAALAAYLIHSLRPRLKKGVLAKDLASQAARIPGVTVMGYRPNQDEKLRQLQAFVDEHGRLPSPSHSRPAGERALSVWCTAVLGKPPAEHHPETAARIAAVRAIVESVPRPEMVRAEAILSGLEAFVHEHGRLPALGGREPEYLPAMTWLARRKKDGDAEKFGPDTALRINELLRQDGPTEQRWEARLHELNDFVKERGKLPTGFGDGPIYSWLRTQRGRYRQGTLDPQREQALRAIEGALPRRLPGRPRHPGKPPRL